MVAQPIERPLRLAWFVEMAEGIQSDYCQRKSPTQIQDQRIHFDQLDLTANSAIHYPCPSNRQHGRRDIDADNVKAGFGEWRKDPASPARDLEHRSAGASSEANPKREIVDDVPRFDVVERGEDIVGLHGGRILLLGGQMYNPSRAVKQSTS